MTKFKKCSSFTFLSILFLFLLWTANLSASDDFPLLLPPKLHTEYALDTNMTVQDVTEKMGIPSERFKSFFKLNPRDTRVDTSTLASNNIFLDDVYQLYFLDKYGFNDFTTLLDVSLVLEIPYKKLAGYLNLDQQDIRNRSRNVRDLGLESFDILIYREMFKKDSMNYISTLTLIGIFVVFLALVIVATLVSKLTVFNTTKKDAVTVKKIDNMNIIAAEKASSEFLNYEDAIVAIVAAIHRFKSEIANDHKILLTYRRIDVSMWQASGKIETPNRQYNLIKK